MLESGRLNRDDGKVRGISKSTHEPFIAPSGMNTTVANNDGMDIDDTMAETLVANEQQPPLNRLRNDSDEALMCAYGQADDMKAFETLYGRHKDPLLRFFLRQMGSRAQAEEVFQETWQSIIRNRQSYQATAKFTTYLYQVARTRLIDHYRKSGKVQWQEFDEQEHSEKDVALPEPISHEEQIDSQQVKQLLIQAIEALPPAQREVIVLRFETTMSMSEIGETLGVNTEAVKSRLRYAVQKLHKELSQYSIDENTSKALSQQLSSKKEAL